MSDESLSGPLPISGHRKPPFDVAGDSRVPFPFIRVGYWEAERRKFKAKLVDEMPVRQVVAEVKLPRAPKLEGGLF